MAVRRCLKGATNIITVVGVPDTWMPRRPWPYKRVRIAFCSAMIRRSFGWYVQILCLIPTIRRLSVAVSRCTAESGYIYRYISSSPSACSHPPSTTPAHSSDLPRCPLVSLHTTILRARIPTGRRCRLSEPSLERSSRKLFRQHKALIGAHHPHPRLTSRSKGLHWPTTARHQRRPGAAPEGSPHGRRRAMPRAQGLSHRLAKRVRPPRHLTDPFCRRRTPRTRGRLACPGTSTPTRWRRAGIRMPPHSHSRPTRRANSTPTIRRCLTATPARMAGTNADGVGKGSPGLLA